MLFFSFKLILHINSDLVYLNFETGFIIGTILLGCHKKVSLFGPFLHFDEILEI